MPPSFSRRINPVHRIIAAISEHIESDEIAVGVYVAVCIDKSAYTGVVISAVEVIEACLVIVVIASVTERVISADGIGCRASDGKYLSPCVVGIGDNTVSRGIVDAGNVTLYIGAEKIRLLRHRIADALEIVYAYRLSRGVVDVYQQISGAPGHPLLIKYAGPRKMIYMLYPVYGLARANPVGIECLHIASGLLCTSKHRLCDTAKAKLVRILLKSLKVWNYLSSLPFVLKRRCLLV